MLSMMGSHSHWIPSLKLLLVSSGVLSVVVVLKFSVPVVADILVSDVPVVWSSMLLWLRPPYLYLLVNFIIISILASSKLHVDLVDPTPTVPLVVSAPVAKLSTDSETDDAVYRVVDDVPDKGACDANESSAANVSENNVKMEVELESRVLERQNDGIGEKDWSRLHREDSMELLFLKYERKPPLPSKVGHRKAAKAHPEGKTLGGSTMKGHGTLDDTWKMITEGRSKKSDTWELHASRDKPADQNTRRKTKKSESFHERSDGVQNLESRQSPGSVRMRKKSSSSEEELNRRVEAFIEKFKQEMRLQREESLKKFQEMMSRGTH